jgi:lysophospholipase L1-like esterase
VEAVSDTEIQFVVQGQPLPGPAEVVLGTADGTHSLGPIFEYLPPGNAHFEVMAALGASLTQGVQRGVPSYHGSLMSPATQIARQAGAYFPLPLLKEGLFPQIGTGEISAPPECAIPSIVEFVAGSAVSVIVTLTNAETGEIAFANGRLDPEITVHNVAVGGARVSDILRGPKPDNVGVNFIGHLVLDLEGDLLSPTSATQIEHIEALNPTLIVSSDFFFNDIAYAVLTADLDPEVATPADELAADINDLVERLAATGAQVFLPTMPWPGLLPAAIQQMERMEEEAANAAMGAIAERAVLANEALIAVAAKHDNVHVVPVAEQTEELMINGIEVSGQWLTTQKLGGLLGLDGVHFTDTGYALVANTFIETINDVLHSDIPAIDLTRILADDVESPTALKEAGLDPSLCD